MNKKNFSTYDSFISKLTPKQKREFDQEYHDLVTAEMLLAGIENGNPSIGDLAEAGKKICIKLPLNRRK